MADGQGTLQLPGQPSVNTNLPGNFQLLVFDGFAGLNTKPQRPAIEDQEMSWCDNLMPIGKNNLRALYDIGTSIYTATSGNTLSYFSFGNIADSPIMVGFESDGKIVQVNTATLASTIIASTGTITTPTNPIGTSQWGSQYILITAPQTNGYFIWDGSLFYEAGTVGPQVTISNSGTDYTAPPTIQAIGGTATVAATFSATIQGNAVSTITVQSAGSGYSSGDVVYLAFSGGSSKTSAIALATISGGVVTAITVSTQGTGYAPSTVSVSIQGGQGIGATATAVMGATGTGVTSITIKNGGQGYVNAPTVVITDTNNPVAQATVQTMPFGIQGTSIETFAQRVWISNGGSPTSNPPKSRTVFTAPNNVMDFSPADGAGAFLSTDSFLRVGFHGLRQSNGFLYLVGDSSVNYISGVTTSGNPPITTFSNQNVDPQIGTPWPNTLQVFSRAIVFANTFGVHALYGGSVQKVSAPLDGIYTTVTPTGASPVYANGFVPSAAVAILNGIHVYMLLIPIIDPITNLQRNALCIWDGQKWWTAGPSVTLTQVSTQEINSVLTAYGTDGMSVYPLFNTASNKITKTVQSKWWDKPTYVYLKRAQRVAGLLKSLGTSNATLTLQVDTELGSDTVSAIDQNAVTWINNASQVVTWTNASGNAVTWVNQLTGLFVLPVDVTGALMGITAKSTTPDFIIQSISVAAQQYESRI